MTAFPWEPAAAADGNYIDAMAIWRGRPPRVGGYTTDHRLYGWEDYDLWCRLAESGGLRGFRRPGGGSLPVARHSMISTTDLSVATAFSVIAERHPVLFDGVRLPV